jgi:hypothetical protein
MMPPYQNGAGKHFEILQIVLKIAPITAGDHGSVALRFPADPNHLTLPASLQFQPDTSFAVAGPGV